MPSSFNYNHLDLEKPLLDQTFNFPDRTDAKSNTILPYGEEGYSQISLTDPMHIRWRGYIGTFIAENLGKDSEWVSSFKSGLVTEYWVGLLVSRPWHISDFVREKVSPGVDLEAQLPANSFSAPIAEGLYPLD